MESGWTWDRLDPFERRVAELLLEGKSNAEICAEVFLSRARVQECIKRVLIKTRTRTTRSAIVLLAEEKETQSLLCVLDQATDGVIVIQDRVLKFVNHTLARGCGYDINEMVGMPLAELAAPESRDAVVKRYELRMQGHQVPVRDVITIQCKQGHARDARVTSAGLIRYMGRPAIMAVAVWQEGE
jgi:PAS domain S-box-containing protein